MKYIYSFTNNINNKKYIGSTINDPKIRYKQHLYHVENINDYRYNYPLYQAIRKYGIENFTFNVELEIDCSELEIRKIEQEYILKNNSLIPNGYNLTLNTEHPFNDSYCYKKMSETKRENAKQVVALTLNNEIIGIYRSIVDCSESLNIDEKKIGACCRGERLTTNNKKFYWINENNEYIIPDYKRDSYKGEKGTTQKQITNKKVAKINLETNEILFIYDSIALAARENECDASCISKVCRGKRNSAKGFKWKYVE